MGSTPPTLTAAQITGLAAMAMAALLITNDFTAFTVVLPTLERAFKVDITTAQWIVNGYALVFGALIVSGGRLADMLGRRRIFLIGTAIFAIFSFVGGIADTIWQVLIARALIGIGGALMWPAVIGIFFNLMPKEKAGLAGGIIMCMTGLGNAMGPLLGGGLTDAFSWRWVFYINVPIAIAAILMTIWALEKDPEEEVEEKLDYAGVAALSLGLFGLLLLLDIGAGIGWLSPYILALFGASLLALVAFFFIERRAGENALIPQDVRGNRSFAIALVATLLIAAVYLGALLYLPQFMIKELKFSAYQSGVGLLPLIVTFAAVAFIAAPLYEKLGAKLMVSIGSVCLAAGMYLLSWIPAITSYIALVPGMMIFGVGVGLFFSSITTAAVTALDPSRASLAGAIVYMSKLFGAAIGLGLNTAVVVAAPSLPEGIQWAFLLNSGLALLGLLVCLFFVDGPFSFQKLFSGIMAKKDVRD